MSTQKDWTTAFLRVSQVLGYIHAVTLSPVPDLETLWGVALIDELVDGDKMDPEHARKIVDLMGKELFLLSENVIPRMELGMSLGVLDDEMLLEAYQHAVKYEVHL